MVFEELVEDAYGEGESGDVPVTPEVLYLEPERLNWVDVSELRDKTGAMAVWPSTAGVVVSDREGRVLVQYPNGRYGAQDIMEGPAPRYVVPSWFLRGRN